MRPGSSALCCACDRAWQAKCTGSLLQAAWPHSKLSKAFGKLVTDLMHFSKSKMHVFVSEPCAWQVSMTQASMIVGRASHPAPPRSGRRAPLPNSAVSTLVLFHTLYLLGHGQCIVQVPQRAERARPQELHLAHLSLRPQRAAARRCCDPATSRHVHFLLVHTVTCVDRNHDACTVQVPYGPSEHDREKGLAPGPSGAPMSEAAARRAPLILGRPGARPMETGSQAFTADAPRGSPSSTQGRKYV